MVVPEIVEEPGLHNERRRRYLRATELLYFRRDSSIEPL